MPRSSADFGGPRANNEVWHQTPLAERQCLNETGFVDGRNVAIEYR